MCYPPQSTFHEVGLLSLVEDEPEELDIEGEAGEKADHNVEEEGWDDLILEDSETQNQMVESHISIIFVFFILEPQLGPELSWSQLSLTALAQPEDFESQSHEQPGQSRSFQAKPGWNITAKDTCHNLFHCSSYTPSLRVAWKICSRWGVIMSALIFSTTLEMPSAPEVFYRLRLMMCLYIQPPSFQLGVGAGHCSSQ